MPNPTPAASYVRLLSHYGSVHFGFAQEYGPFGADVAAVSLPVVFSNSEDMVDFLHDLLDIIQDEVKYLNASIAAFDNGGVATWSVITDNGNEYAVRLDLYVGI